MFSANYILKICILLSVLVYFTQGSKSQSEEKKINIKIGFDLTQGENGAPSLKIRDFEKESAEFHSRANEGKSNDGPSVRADSYSENSAEKDEKKKDASKEHVVGRLGSKSKESSSDDGQQSDPTRNPFQPTSKKGGGPQFDYSDENRGISTRGLDDEYEPEAARLGKDKPKHVKSKESKSSSSEESASGGDKDDGRRHLQGMQVNYQGDADARRYEDAAPRAKRNVPTLKGLMENIRKRSRELFVADRRQAEMKAKKS